MKIFVVEGSTGDPDYRSWLVLAYRTKAAARKKALRCAERARLLFLHSEYDDRWADEDSSVFRKWLKDEDPKAQVCYTGTNYRIIEVELEEW